MLSTLNNALCIISVFIIVIMCMFFLCYINRGVHHAYRPASLFHLTNTPRVTFSINTISFVVMTAYCLWWMVARVEVVFKFRVQERIAQKHIFPCVKQIASGSLLCDTGSSTLGSVTTWRGGVGKEDYVSGGRRHIYTCG